MDQIICDVNVISGLCVSKLRDSRCLDELKPTIQHNSDQQTTSSDERRPSHAMLDLAAYGTRSHWASYHVTQRLHRALVYSELFGALHTFSLALRVLRWAACMRGYVGGSCGALAVLCAQVRAKYMTK